jgi:sec-independent protein translocase protein TatA
MHFVPSAEIFGMDGMIVLIVVVLVLFGSTQIPKLARSLGSAQKEFKQGLNEPSSGDDPVAAGELTSPQVKVSGTSPGPPVEPPVRTE